MQTSEISRRDFLKTSALSAGALVVMTLVPRAEASGQRLKTTIYKNHGHRFTASLREVIAAGSMSYSIRGMATHTHYVMLTQEMVNTLLEQRIIEVESSTSHNHSHMIRFEIV